MVSFLVGTLFSQSNTPCSGATIIAPALPVGATCTYQSGTTVGATTQTNAANGGTPTCGSMGEDVWYSITAPASGAIVLQTTSGSTTDGVMALYSGGCGAFTQIACDDDGGVGLMPEITATGLTPGATYFVRFWDYAGGTGTFNICATATTGPPPGATNTTCVQPNPICSGSPINFTANTGGADASTVNPGNNYGCLFTSPNPSWYYLEIATGGNLVIDIAAGSDVDFAIWGPFASVGAATAQCNSYGAPVDCSYSTAATEQVNVAGTVTSQVYVLLVTNYANTVQNISVNNSGGTATTNCAIVPLPVELADFDGVRNGDRVTLNWLTYSETNCDYFIVERSEDGVSWSAFDLIEGNGNSNQTTAYSTTDSNPFDVQNYYRLKQFDFNGSIFTSDIISISNKSFIEMTVYPNPAKDRLKVSSNEFFNVVTILDVTGNIISQFKFDSIKQTEVSLAPMKNGVYFVQTLGTNGQTTKRLVIQN